MSGFLTRLVEAATCGQRKRIIIGQHRAVAADLHALSPRPYMGLRLLPAGTVRDRVLAWHIALQSLQQVLTPDWCDPPNN